jgi:hypothetical protein
VLFRSIQLSFDERRKSQSTERLALAETINTAMQSTATTVRSMSALTSAPPPPAAEQANEEVIKVWLKEYNDWYDVKRNNGLKVG